MVAMTGDDGNPGSPDQPWRTLQHAASIAQAGDTVLVRDGTYHEEVILARTGLPGRPITFAAYPNETPVLDGNHDLYAGFQTSDEEPDPLISDIVLRGFTIRNFRGFGVVAWSINDRLVLEDLVIQDNGDTGIRLSNSDGSRVQNVLLQGNEGGFDCTPILPGRESDPGCTHLTIRDVQAVDNGTQGDTATDAFAVERGSHILVERCLASGGVGDGFDFKSDHTTLRQVIAHGARNNIKLWGRGSTVVNALAYDATADANLVLAAGGSYTITHVTIANMAGTAYLVVVGDPSTRGNTPVRISDSIFYNSNRANSGTLLYLAHDVKLLGAQNNLFFNPYRSDAVICADYAPLDGRCYGETEINDGIWPQPGNRYADPLFLDATGKEFHLQAGSPAIDRGTPDTSTPIDLDGCPRDSAPDLGAFEAGGC